MCVAMVLAILMGIIILFILYGYVSNYVLTVSKHHMMVSTCKAPFCIAFLSDLHGCKHGRNNEKLIRRIREQNPDFVVMTGDMIVKNGMGEDDCLFLCKELRKDYPIYYSAGNHEIRMPDYDGFVHKLQEIGVCYLDNETSILEIQGQEIQLTGLNLPNEYYGKFWERMSITEEVLEQYIKKPDKKKLRILLAHNPEYFPTYASWGADIVLSGHLHGGIMKLPFGGVIAPSLRLFPKYSSGIYQEKNSTMVLSRGLGLHHIKFRFFNYPELIFLFIEEKQ